LSRVVDIFLPGLLADLSSEKVAPTRFASCAVQLFVIPFPDMFFNLNLWGQPQP
jgi:hypothetical protein